MNEIVQALRNAEKEIERLRRKVDAISPSFGQLSIVSFPAPVPPSSGGTGISGSPLGVTMWLNGEAFGTTQGQVVRIKSGSDRTFELADTAGETDVIGVLDDALAAGANGRVRHIGYQNIVDVEDDVAVGDWLRASSTAGRAESAGSSPVLGVFGVALTAHVGVGTGQVAAFVFPPELFDPSTVYVELADAGLTVDAARLRRLIVPTGSLQELSDGVFAFDPSTELVLEDLTGLSDGATTDYPTSDFFVSGSARVWQNGLMLRPLVDYTEGTNLDRVVLAVAPAALDVILVQYQAQIGA